MNLVTATNYQPNPNQIKRTKAKERRGKMVKCVSLSVIIYSSNKGVGILVQRPDEDVDHASDIAG